MGIVAVDALPFRLVLGGIDLRKRGRFRRIRAVAAQAERPRIELAGRRLLRVVDVRREWAVARLATDFSERGAVVQLLPLVVAVGASLPPGEAERMRPIVGERSRAVMTVKPEAGRNENGAKGDERRDSREEEKSDPDEVLTMLETPSPVHFDLLV